MAKNTQNKSGTKDKDVQKYMDIFSFCYKKSEKDFTRLKSLQQSYDNTVLDTAWPTTSKIPIAAFYDAVEKALPVALEYLSLGKPTLMPLDAGVTMEQVRKSETALNNLVTYRMKLYRNSIATLKDTFKCGVGFGIIEPFFVTPPSSFELTEIEENGEMGRSTRVMELGAPKKSLRFRYLNPGQVVIMPDGNDFNGNSPVSISFLLDIYSETQLKDMYKANVGDGEKPDLLGSVDDIIAEARSTGFNSDTDILVLISKMAGINMQSLTPDTDSVPIHVPILKVFDGHKHLWIANGTTKIYEQENEFQNMRCPLIKASAWIDSNRFYPMSTPEAYQRIAWAKNIIVNLFLDLMTMNLRRPIVYNSEFFDKEPTFGPDGRIRTSAPDARMGAAYLEGPRMDPASMTVYEMINGIGEGLTGQKDYMDKNYTRGGAMAFQDLLSSTEGIDRLKGTILEMTFLESVYEQSLIYLQTNVGEEGEVVRTREKKKVAGGETEETIVDLTVTEDDLCHAYDLSLDLKSKYRKGAMEQNASLAIYDRKKASEFFDQYEVAAEHLCSSDEEVRREMKSREEVARLEAENRELAVREREMNIAESQQGATAEAVSAGAGIPEGGAV